MAKYFVFLDVDGVLTSQRVQFGHTCTNHPMWDKFDPVAVDFFNYIDATYDVDFVLMSSWKTGLKMDDVMLFHWVSAAFRNAGFRGTLPYKRWKTDFPEFPKEESYKYNERAWEVKHYLEQYECDDFMLFDDTAYKFNEVLGRKRFVRTSAQDGLLSKHMLHAMSLMGQWEKKK